MKKTKKEKKRLFVISTVIILLIVSLISSVAGDYGEKSKASVRPDAALSCLQGRRFSAW